MGAVAMSEGQAEKAVQGMAVPGLSMPGAGRRPRPGPGAGMPRLVPECGHFSMRIARDGTWHYRGSPIGRKELVCLFASVLKREEDGSYWLETPVERGRSEVEDAPFVAVELGWAGIGRDQVLTFRTNVDQVVTAGPKHPIRMAFDIVSCEPTPYVHVRDGAGRHPLEARIGRAVYYELVALAEPGEVQGRQVLGVWSSGVFFPLGDLPDEAAPGDDEEG